MSNIFRNKIPVRTCTKKYANYRQFKPYLREDFNKSCGYCNDHDYFSGGPNFYHIDHFVPQKVSVELSHSYSNLVYTCFYCNNAKSNKWPSGSATDNILNDEGFIDPCSEEYDTHFKRDSHGEIIPLTPLGNYMHRNLHLHLERHKIIWKLNQIQEELEKIKGLSIKKKLTSNQQKMIKELNNSYIDFTKRLHRTYDV